ncbi:hypothetical protein LCGC14_1037030 [marine sediment metagenome]|uniref:Uncharacterized protein n=1 Tax=marine sediment metagenome TaxID=412755 RepID=A0A0F9NEH6_9ZZZZ
MSKIKDCFRWAGYIFLFVFIFRETGIATLVFAILVGIDRELNYLSER